MPAGEIGTSDDLRWTRNRIFVVLLCALAGTIDSFDTQMIGFTGRPIATDLGFPVAQLGWLFGAGQLGGVIGALVFGSLADRFGRRRMLVLTCAMAAAFTAASLAAASYSTLLTYRVLTGIGLGGIMPCFLGLGVEAMLARSRLTLTPVLYASFPLGGAVGAWISAPLIVSHGWRGVFAFGAVALALIATVMVVAPKVGEAVTDEADAGQLSRLLIGRMARVTLPLWALFLLAPSGIYLLVLWMPPLLQLLGVSAARTSMLVGFPNIGALFVALTGRWAMTRFGRLGVLAPVLLIGALSCSASR